MSVAKSNTLRRLVRRKLFGRMISDAIEWQDSLRDAYTLKPWHQTKGTRMQASRYAQNMQRYRELAAAIRIAANTPAHVQTDKGGS